MPLVEVFNNGTLVELERSLRHESSYFGGPVDAVVNGLPWRSKLLHHVATLWNNDIGVSNPKFGFKVPFLYGLGYEGCNLAYQRTAVAAVKVTSLEPRTSADDYPYEGYPRLLPYVPLKVGSRQECAPEKFFERLVNTGWEYQPGRIYVLVPDPPDIGFTLWGPSGNDTDIVFEYDPANGVMRACNQCS